MRTPSFKFEQDLDELEPESMAQNQQNAVKAAVGSTLLRREEQIGSSSSYVGKVCLASGSTAIDNTLNGGFPMGKMTLLSTSALAAKTTLSYNIIVHHLLNRPTSEAVVIDSSGEFSVHILLEVAERVLQARRHVLPPDHQGYIYEISSHQDQTSNTDAEPAALFDRIKLVRVFDVAGTVEAVSEIGQVCRSQIVSWAGSSDLRKIDLLFIDDLSSVFQPMQTRNNVEAQSLICSLFRSLSYMTRMHGICTIVFNGVVDGRAGTRYRKEERADQDETEMVSSFPMVTQRPALGKAVSHFTDLSLLLFVHPKERMDAEVAYAPPGTVDDGSWSPAYVMEILKNKDDCGHDDVAVFSIRDYTMQDLGGVASGCD